ncbi:MAG: class I SAM-dependent rRNA methyltransferase [Bacteroidetes bacterium]|nr:class I SAM-dependent rRNA methyltransferase [Bacteroidota bacterium]
MNYPQLVLKSGRDRAVRNRHPWIFSGAVKERPAKVGEGEIVAVCTNDGEVLGLGHYAPQSTLICRLFHFGKDEVTIDAEFWHRKLLAAWTYRTKVLDLQTTTGYRLVHAEGDSLPGIVIDIYGDAASVQLRTLGTAKLAPVITQFLENHLGIAHIYLRTETKEEGEGKWIKGEEAERTFTENGVSFYVDIATGQKTGFFLDQRDNKTLLKSMAKGRRVLNAFSYSGAFSVYALAGGAVSVDSVDISASAAELATRNVMLNFGENENHSAIKADAFKFLAEMEKDKYDLIILDPPAFTKHISTVQKAARGYKEINLKAMQRIAPGGLLFTYSCSQHISTDLFRKIVFGAAADAGREVRIVHQMTQAPDHPVSIYHPEGEYLKGLCLYVE